jgi:hypothetical protein
VAAQLAASQEGLSSVSKQDSVHCLCDEERRKTAEEFRYMKHEAIRRNSPSGANGSQLKLKVTDVSVLSYAP